MAYTNDMKLEAVSSGDVARVALTVIDEADLHWLWKETVARLDRLAGLVREGKSVAEAADFCKWLQFSGLSKLFQVFPQAAPCVVDHVVIEKKIRDLLFECGELFRGGKADPKYAASDIAEINRKLDIIAAHVSQFPPPFVATTEPGKSDLHVLQGGAFC